MNGYGQVQRDYFSSNGMFNSARVMQPMPYPQSEINTSQLKSQQASLENTQPHKKVGTKRQVLRRKVEKETSCQRWQYCWA